MRLILKGIAPTLALMLAMTGAGPAGAHSLEGLETSLFEKEQYFQPLEGKQAPGFALRDATVGPSDWTTSRARSS